MAEIPGRRAPPREMILVSDPINESNAATRKSEIHADVAPKQWYFQNFASPEVALNYVNASPAHIAGEISANARNDGSVGMFYFV
jgi:hypothetical protein